MAFLRAPASYAVNPKEVETQQTLHELMRTLAVCHTVVIDQD